MELNISERVIEDILKVDKSILAEILSLNSSDLNLLARQKIVQSGIIDLLYVWRDELLLIELKAVPFYNDIITQIENYYQDLLLLQSENKLLKTSIRKIILVTSAKPIHFTECRNNSIDLLVYDPKLIFSRYYENFKELSQFLKIQSGDFGVVRLGLLNSTLKFLGEGLSAEEIAKIENKSIKTIKNRISIAILINLVIKFKKVFYLTELGQDFINASESIDDRLTETQTKILQSFVKEAPFYSSITYTIFSIVETVFILSKNIYPVPKDLVKDYFVKSIGKSDTWNAEKSKETATYIFSNYAVELEFLAKVNNEFFITPLGIQAILLLQLNRSIKLIENKTLIL
jgi:hypothetical protein